MPVAGARRIAVEGPEDLLEGIAVARPRPQLGGDLITEVLRHQRPFPSSSRTRQRASKVVASIPFAKGNESTAAGSGFPRCVRLADIPVLDILS
jgi:hypothetical protein